MIISPCWYAWVKWVLHGTKSRSTVAELCFTGILLSLVTLATSPWLGTFVLLVIASPFILIGGMLYAIWISILNSVAFLLSKLARYCVLRPLSYPRSSASANVCRLCETCQSIVQQSTLLRGTRWIFTRPIEKYDFYGIKHLSQSAINCHLCCLLYQSGISSGSGIGVASGALPSPGLENISPISKNLTTRVEKVGSVAVPNPPEHSRLKVHISATRSKDEQILSIQLHDNAAHIKTLKIITAGEPQSTLCPGISF